MHIGSSSIDSRFKSGVLTANVVAIIEIPHDLLILQLFCLMDIKRRNVMIFVVLVVLSVVELCLQECLQRLFSDCGKVEAVHLHENPANASSSDSMQPPSQFFTPHNAPSVSETLLRVLIAL